MTETPRPGAQRHDQMFPILSESEIARVAGFGERRLSCTGAGDGQFGHHLALWRQQ